MEDGAGRIIDLPPARDATNHSQTDCSASAGLADGRIVKEKTCNIWTEQADYRCIPTTGATDADGAILDSGVGLEATKRFSGVAADLGRLLSSRGNHVHQIRPGLLSFPIQQFAWGGPSPQRISQSVEELIAIVGDRKTLLPRPGVFRGGLEWDQVKPLLADLPDNIIVVEHTP